MCILYSGMAEQGYSSVGWPADSTVVTFHDAVDRDGTDLHQGQEGIEE